MLAPARCRPPSINHGQRLEALRHRPPAGSFVAPSGWRGVPRGQMTQEHLQQCHGPWPVFAAGGSMPSEPVFSASTASERIGSRAAGVDGWESRPSNRETAWDVKSHSIKIVPGFGPALTKKLMDRRRSVESRFKFNPNIPTDPAEIAKVRAEIAVHRSALEAEPIKGGRDPEAIRAEALANRGDASQYQAHYLAFRQAETDAAAF